MPTISPENRPPTAQTQNGGEAAPKEEKDWLERGQSAYRASTSYIDNNMRAAWEDAIRAFNNQHSASSKYNSQSFEKRSKLFRPKTRTIIRKNEAAAAAAFFSNMEVVDIAAQDPSNKEELANADIMKQLLELRLSKYIKWYHIVLGGLQEAQTMGAVVAHIYWEYEAEPVVDNAQVEVTPLDGEENEYPVQTDLPKGAFTMGGEQIAEPEPVQVEITAEIKPKVKRDQPCIKLIPVENIRIDPGADWMDPINSSPYVIEVMPMYIMDIKAKAEKGEWREVSDGELRNATVDRASSTRAARANGKEDPYQQDSKSLMDHEVAWVHRHIHRVDGEDWEFYMLSDQMLLTDPVPLSQNVLHGLRPYVMGCSILEAHRLYPTSVPVLAKDLQEQANEIANQRIDNVKFVLNKKWFVKRGKDADIGGLVRNVPGGVVLLDDPVNDVREINFPDVTASAYQEQQSIDGDMNDLLGNFSAAQVMADHGINGPARNMAMLSQSSGTLVEYMLRTYTETFIQPVLRQLIKLEQAYETDDVILSLAGKRANIMQRYGINEVTDNLLEKELTLTVNVGMGATDPQMKLQKFVAAMNTFVGMMEKKVPGINMQEVGKEIFGHLGYADGSRFFTTDNPQMLQLQQQLQQQQMELQKLQLALQNKNDKHLVDIHKATLASQTKLQDTQIKEAHEDQRNATTHLRALTEMQAHMQHERVMKHLDGVGKQMSMKEGSK